MVPVSLLVAHAKELKGYFVEPTVIRDVKPNMSIVREENFGPVVVAEPFTKVEDVLPRANQTEYGLAAGVWTRTSLKLIGSQPA